jgi:hypothetical protein
MAHLHCVPAIPSFGGTVPLLGVVSVHCSFRNLKRQAETPIVGDVVPRQSDAPLDFILGKSASPKCSRSVHGFVPAARDLANRLARRERYLGSEPTSAPVPRKL